MGEREVHEAGIKLRTGRTEYLRILTQQSVGKKRSFGVGTGIIGECIDEEQCAASQASATVTTSLPVNS